MRSAAVFLAVWHRVSWGNKSVIAAPGSFFLRPLSVTVGLSDWLGAARNAPRSVRVNSCPAQCLGVRRYESAPSSPANGAYEAQCAQISPLPVLILVILAACVCVKSEVAVYCTHVLLGKCFVLCAS